MFADEIIDADNNDNADFDDDEEGQEEQELLGVGNELGLRGLVNEQGLVWCVDKGVQTVQPSMPAVFPLHVPNPLVQC